MLGDGKNLVGPEAHSVVEPRRVVDAGDVERADADPIAGEADANVLPREVVLVEERFQLLRERIDVANRSSTTRPLSIGRRAT